MTHVRFDDSTPWHPRILAMSDTERWAWFKSICYSSRFRTDGELDEPAQRECAPKKTTREALITHGRWEQNGSAVVYIHDYLDHQRSREQINAAIESAKAAAKKRWT